MLSQYVAGQRVAMQQAEPDPAPDRQTVARLEAIARGGIARAAPLRFAVAGSDAERTAVYRLRYTTIVEHGWASPETLPDGLERDEYDDAALHIVCLNGDAVVACARLVFPRAGVPLPTERVFDLCVEPRGRVVDLSRQIVARAYSSSRHTIFGALLATCWLEVQARGYCHVCGDFTPGMVRLYRRMGMQVAVLGPARWFWGDERVPIVQDVVGAVDALTARWAGGS